MPRLSTAMLVVVLGLLLAGLAPAVVAEDAIEQEVASCLECHGERDFTAVLDSGETVSLTVDRAMLAASVHGKGLRCTDCHPRMDELPHPERAVKNASEFHAGFGDTCKPCHFDKYALSADGVHGKLLANGNEMAPGCVDCHGAHDVAPAGKPRTRISDTCAACHPDVADTYMKSVHGEALTLGNEDVPVCIDCHRAHDISDPRVTSWIVKTPELCARCHTDTEKMEKYGLSTNVVQSYLSDFHGVTAATSRARGSGASGEDRKSVV